MKMCPNPKCGRAMDDSAISCICGRYFTPQDRALSSGGDAPAENMMPNSSSSNTVENGSCIDVNVITQRKMPNILKGYMIALGIVCLILMGGKLIEINRVYVLNTTRMIISTIIGYGIVFSVLWIMVARMISRQSDTSRWILIVITFPLGLLLIAPSVEKYVSPWEHTK